MRRRRLRAPVCPGDTGDAVSPGAVVLVSVIPLPLRELARRASAGVAVHAGRGLSADVSAGYLLDGLDCVVERLVRAGPSRLDVGQLRRERVLDLRVVETDRRDLHLAGDVGEDLAGRRIAEVGIHVVLDGRTGVSRLAGREVAHLGEPGLLLRRSGYPLNELDRGFLVLSGGWHADPRTAPVGGAARQHRSDVPLALVGVAGLALDVAGHPRRAGDRGEGTGLERLVPLVGELLQASRDLRRRGVGGVLPGVLHAVAVLDVRGAVGLVVGLVALVNSGAEDACSAVDELALRLPGR